MRWRKQTRQPSSPNFLFSLPPFFEADTEVPMIVVVPRGENDTPQIQAAINRLQVVDGGTIRFSVGDYFGGPYYIDQSEVPR